MDELHKSMSILNVCLFYTCDKFKFKEEKYRIPEKEEDKQQAKKKHK